MEVKNKRRKLNTKLAAASLLAAYLSCTPIFAINTIMGAEPQNSKLLALAEETIIPITKDYDTYLISSKPDFSLLELNPAKPIKLINPLYLDTSKTVKPVIKTFVPYNPNTENTDSDYFSSEIDESTPTATPKTDTDEIPAKVATPPPSQGDTQEKSDFFAPPNIADEPVQELQRSEESTYVVGVDTNNAEQVDLEGKIISDIEFRGLHLLSPEIISSKIKTQSGSLFNEDLLQQDLQRIYAIGFFTDKMAIEPTLNSDDTVTLTFELQENIAVSNVSIVGNTVISTMELMPFVMPLKGLPQNISNINTAIDNMSGYYHKKGYILAGVSSVDDDPDGALTFTLTEGVIDKIIIEGNEKTKDYVIERNIMTQPGTVYNENYLKEDLGRIYSTKIFKDVDRQICPSDTVEGEYNVKVVVKEDSSNSLAIGGGIDNGLGAFGSLTISENNFLGRGQKLSATGILGSGILLSDASIKNRMNYQFELNFFEPQFLNADNSLMSKLYYRDMGSWQVPLAIERRFGISAGVEHKFRNVDGVTADFTTGIEHISMSEGDYNKISQMYALRGLDISQRAKQLTGGTFINFAPGIKYSTLDSDENPRNGIVANAKFIEAVSISSIRNTNGRIAGGITKYFPVLKKSSFALNARGGIKVHGDDMPEVMAFRLGGPYSIRGFRMSGVGSGDAFIMGSAELATPLPFSDRVKWDFFQKIRLTFFVDAGKVFDPTISSRLYDRPMSAITAGVGLKVYVPGVGPISVDYGIPITNPGSYGSKNGYFTFGTGGMNYYGY